MWARENTAYLHKVLGERQPAFCATLRAAERQVDQHTTVPPKCGARAGCGESACVLTAGHPGPHLPAASVA